MKRGSLDLIWELPLSLLSWLFFKINKSLIGLLYQQYLSRNLTRGVTWRMLSAETLKIPIILPVLMTKGPRWNTHGVIGTLGPFPIESRLTIDLTQAQKSAESWTVVIYRYPDYATITQLSWLQSKAEQNDGNVTLPKGNYSLGIRYYGLSDQAVMPTVTFDHGEPLAGIEVPENTNEFYDYLSDRGNCYYLALHYYIFTLLRLRDRLPESWVRAEYLPVGDPDTTFLYDCFNSGESLRVQVNPLILNDYWVYLTAYNRASLPILSTAMTAADQTTSPFTEDGYYLFRLRPQSSKAPDLNLNDVTVTRI